jgi:hypothetical protein
LHGVSHVLAKSGFVVFSQLPRSRALPGRENDALNHARLADEVSYCGYKDLYADAHQEEGCQPHDDLPRRGSDQPG